MLPWLRALALTGPTYNHLQPFPKETCHHFPRRPAPIFQGHQAAPPLNKANFLAWGFFMFFWFGFWMWGEEAASFHIFQTALAVMITPASASQEKELMHVLSLTTPVLSDYIERRIHRSNSCREEKAVDVTIVF